MKKEVVNVRNQEEWDYVTEKLGYVWSAIRYGAFEEDSCIDLNSPYISSVCFYQGEGYSIISFEEFKSRYEPLEEVINLTIEQAKEFIPKDKWKEFGIEEEIVLRDWKELDFENSFYPEFNGRVIGQTASIYSDTTLCLNVPTEKHAKSMLAFAKLSMLMADLGDECNVDWTSNKEKYTIIPEENYVRKCVSFSNNKFLAFKTEKIRDAFYEKHYELIKEYEML